MKRAIEQDAWNIAQKRPVKQWESMWAADLTKVIRLDPDIRIQEGFYETLVSKTISIQRAWRMFAWVRKTTQKFYYLVEERRKKEKINATYIQSWYRAVSGWRYMQMLLYRRNCRMATMIQKSYRGHLGREKCKRIRKSRLREWIRLTTGIRDVSSPAIKSYGTIYGGVTYKRGLI